MVPDLNNILTAECTLLTMISILTGLWYNDIVSANQMQVKNTPGNATGHCRHNMTDQ